MCRYDTSYHRDTVLFLAVKGHQCNDQRATIHHWEQLWEELSQGENELCNKHTSTDICVSTIMERGGKKILPPSPSFSPSLLYPSLLLSLSLFLTPSFSSLSPTPFLLILLSHFLYHTLSLTHFLTHSLINSLTYSLFLLSHARFNSTEKCVSLKLKLTGNHPSGDYLPKFVSFLFGFCWLLVVISV